MIKFNSRYSYKKLKASGQDVTQKSVIFQVIETHDGITRHQVSKITGITMTSCTARIRELLLDGKVIEAGNVKNKSTKVFNAILKAA